MADLAAPRSEEFGPVSIAGMVSATTMKRVPASWPCGSVSIHTLVIYPGSWVGRTYGVMWPLEGPEGFEYVCGVEVSDLSGVPAEFSQLTLEKQKYAVFSHSGHISTIRDTWGQIGNTWRQASGVRIANRPRLEIYSAAFNPARPGGVEIWIPVEGWGRQDFCDTNPIRWFLLYC